MKQFIKTAVASALIAFSSFASAAVITSDVTAKDPTDASKGIIVNTTTPFKFTFDFTLAKYASAFTLGVDTLKDASLSVLLSDDGGSESFNFLLGTTTVFTGSNVPSSNLYDAITVTATPLATLNSTGKIELTVQALSNSFRFNSAVLSANVQRSTQGGTVPEPLSISLIGLGLAGLAAARRKPAAK